MRMDDEVDFERMDTWEIARWLGEEHTEHHIEAIRSRYPTQAVFGALESVRYLPRNMRGPEFYRRIKETKKYLKESGGW